MSTPFFKNLENSSHFLFGRSKARILAIKLRFGYNTPIGKERKVNLGMKTVNIRLTMMTDHVKNFVSLVNRYPYDIDLRSGRYVVDAKSILGIFSIDLSRPIRMDIYSDDCDDLISALEGYIVKDDAAKA